MLPRPEIGTRRPRRMTTPSDAQSRRTLRKAEELCYRRESGGKKLRQVRQFRFDGSPWVLSMQMGAVAWNYGKARGWWEKAAGEGDPMTMFKLGALYANGQGVPKDLAEALQKWYRLAADRGNANAQTQLGVMYANGGACQKMTLAGMVALSCGARRCFSTNYARRGLRRRPGRASRLR